MKKLTLLNIAVGIGIYLMFSYSMFLGLQVDPRQGNIGILLTALVLVAYIMVYQKYLKKPPKSK